MARAAKLPCLTGLREDAFEMSPNILLWQGGLLGVGAEFPKSQRGWIPRAVVWLLEHASGLRKNICTI